MGNVCCDLFNSNSEDSLPNLILFKKTDLSTVNYIRYSLDSEDSNEIFPSIENYIVVWLTSDIGDDEHSFARLRQIVHSFRIFINIDEFHAFMIEIKDEKLCLILSNSFDRNLIPSIHKICQLTMIYIISDDQSTDQKWMNQYEKIQGISNHIQPICEQLKRILHLSENDIQPMEILDSSTVVIQYLIKQILLSEIDYPDKLKGDLIDFARQQYTNELNVIKEFEENYTSSSAVCWFTRKCFLYSIMEKAFQTQNIEQLMKIGFYIRDLHQQEQQHSIPMIVYRGQGIPENQFQRIEKNTLLSFKNFFWTNTDRTSSLNAARLARNDPELCGILFRIEINSTVSLISSDKTHDGYLFPIYSLFRIDQIKEIDDQLWQIDLSLVENDDQQSIEDSQEQTFWQRLAFYFIQLNQFDKAEEFYKILLDFNLISHIAHLAFIHEQLGILYHHKNDPTNSILFYKKSLKDYQTILPPNDPYLIKIYLNIGLLFHQQNNFHETIKHLKHALNIALHSLPLDRLQISILYNHIGDIYAEQEIFVEAIQNYQSALENELKSLPVHQSSIAKTYNRIGEIFYRMGDYNRALSYFDKTLQIQKKTVSPNDFVLADTNYKIALVLNGLQQYKEAIEYASRSVNIARHSFGSNHTDVQLYEEYLEKLQKKTRINVIPNGSVYG